MHQAGMKPQSCAQCVGLTQASSTYRYGPRMHEDAPCTQVAYAKPATHPVTPIPRRRVRESILPLARSDQFVLQAW